jgi:DNA-binding NarL/FixJ family response regulator
MVVDDHELVRLGLSTLISAQKNNAQSSPSMLEVSTLAKALCQYALHQDTISLVLLDLHLPDAHGLSGLREFLARFPDAPIAVLSGDSDPALKLQALQVGARAYFTKAGQMTDVIAYMRSQGLLAQPVTPVQCECPDASTPLENTPHNGTMRTVCTPTGQPLHLSQRQSDILDGLLAGQSNREIAQHSCLAEGTVRNHVSTLLLMFNVRTRAELISQLR